MVRVRLDPVEGQKAFPFEAILEPPDGGLRQRSKVMLMQLRTIDKRRIIDQYGAISADALMRVEAALRVATGLARV